MIIFPWWTEAQKGLAGELERFADEKTPEAQELVWRRKYPYSMIEEMGRRDWLGAIIPEEYGGNLSKMGYTGSCMVMEQISRISLVNMQYIVTMCNAYMILKFGRETLKKEFLPKMARGEILAALTVTEPYAGNDSAGVETTARQENGSYILNGKKRFITAAGASDIYVILARTSEDPEAIKKHKHLTMFIVKKNAPGFTIERINELTGFDNMYNAYLDLQEVKVDPSKMIGDIGDGWEILMSMVNYERLLASASALGPMGESLRYANFHLQRRVQFGQPTFDLPTNQFKVADIIIRYHTARLLTYYAAYLFDLGQLPIMEVSIAKCFNADEGLKLYTDAIQLMGGDGVTKFYPVESFLRDGKIVQLAPSTSDIMRLILPRFGARVFTSELRPPRRQMHKELNVPVTVGYYGKKPAALLSQEVTKTELINLLAENYKVNPGLYMHREEIKEELSIEDNKLNELLKSLENERLVKLFRRGKENIVLARATLEGLRAAKPLEEYKWFPAWVDQKDIF
ncbi:MAG: hypothetical protein STSR0004_19760 [Peptococcaceae bacterium]